VVAISQLLNSSCTLPWFPGDSKVGKSSLTTVFHGHGKTYSKNYVIVSQQPVSSAFPGERFKSVVLLVLSPKTLGVDFLVKTVRIPDSETKVELYLMDTSGSDIYKGVRARYVSFLVHCCCFLRANSVGVVWQWEGASMLMLAYDMTQKQACSVRGSLRYSPSLVLRSFCGAVVQKLRQMVRGVQEKPSAWPESARLVLFNVFRVAERILLSGILVATKSDMKDYAEVSFCSDHCGDAILSSSVCLLLAGDQRRGSRVCGRARTRLL
jgi:GTPase SAR1 family protein